MKIISKSEAEAFGLTHYYTGKACFKGHISARYVSSRGCVKCADESHIRRGPRHLDPVYTCRANMIYRCTNDMASNYEDYGGRGITVCDRWLDPVYGYANFVADMGPRPEGFTLDRIDYDGNYEPSNCRWADRVTQDRNKRSTKLKGEDVLEVFKLRDGGMSLQGIANIYACTKQNIRMTLLKREIYIEQGLGRSTKAA